MEFLNLRWALHLWLPSIALLASTKWSWTKIHWWQVKKHPQNHRLFLDFLKSVNMVLLCVCVCNNLRKNNKALFFQAYATHQCVTTSVFSACRTSISGAGYAPILGFVWGSFLTEDLKIEGEGVFYLVVEPTHLKNMLVKFGSFPEVEVNIKKHLSFHRLVFQPT